MSSSKRFPEPGGRAARSRGGGGWHRRPPRPVPCLASGQAGARFLAAGALGSAAMAILQVGAAPVASLASTATGHGPLVTLAADILPASAPGAAVPLPLSRPAGAPGAAVPLPVPRPADAPGATVPLPLPRPADAPGPAVPLPVPRPADAPGPVTSQAAENPPASSQQAPALDQFGAGAQPIQMFDITPAPPPQAQQGHSVGVSVNGYSPTSGLGGGVALAADSNAVSLALSLGFGVGGDVKVSVGPPVSTGLQAGFYAQASDSLLGLPKEVPTPLGTIQNPGGKVTIGVPVVNVDSNGNTTFPDFADSSVTLQLNLKPSNLQYSITGKPFSGGSGTSVGPDLTTQGPSQGGLAEAGSYKVADFGSSSGAGVYFKVGVTYQTLANMIYETGKAEYTAQTGRSFDEDFPPTPQEIINQDFTNFPNAAQVGVMQAPVAAQGEQPVPYLFGNPGDPVNPITGVPDSASGTPNGSFNVITSAAPAGPPPAPAAPDPGAAPGASTPSPAQQPANGRSDAGPAPASTDTAASAPTDPTATVVAAPTDTAAPTPMVAVDPTVAVDPAVTASQDPAQPPAPPEVQQATAADNSGNADGATPQAAVAQNDSSPSSADSAPAPVDSSSFS